MNWRVVYIKSKRRQRDISIWSAKLIVLKYSEFSMENLFFFSVNCAKGTQCFHGKVRSSTIYFKIMPFWVTSSHFKKVRYDITLTCNYIMSIFIFWCCFCNTWLLYSEKPCCIRRVGRCSYGTYCAWCNKVIVNRDFVKIL